MVAVSMTELKGGRYLFRWKERIDGKLRRRQWTRQFVNRQGALEFLEVARRHQERATTNKVAPPKPQQTQFA